MLEGKYDRIEGKEDLGESDPQSRSSEDEELEAKKAMIERKRHRHPGESFDSIEGGRRTQEHGDEEVAKTMDSFLDRIPITRYHYLIIFCLGLSNSSDSTEILTMNYINSEVEWKHTGYVSAAVFCGMLFGGLVMGNISDSVGRRRPLIVCLLMNSLSGFLAAFMSTPELMAGMRFFTGLSIGGSIPCHFALASELMPQSQRGYFLTIVGWFWMVGSLYTALLAVIILEEFGGSWRTLVKMCAIPSFVASILVAKYVPESPRSYAVNGQYEDAAKVLNKMAQRCGYAGSKITTHEIRYQIENSQERRLLSTNVEGTLRPINRLHAFIVALKRLFGETLWLRTILLCAVWFCLSFATYGLVTWITSLFKTIGVSGGNGNPYVETLIFATASFPGNVASSIFIERVGRRAVLVTSIGISLLAILGFAGAVSEPKTFKTLIVFAACLFQASSVASWNVLNAVSLESFPTEIRGSSMGILTSCSRIAAMAAQFVNSDLLDRPAILLLVTAATIFVGLVSSVRLGYAVMPRDMTNMALSD